MPDGDELLTWKRTLLALLGLGILLVAVWYVEVYRERARFEEREAREKVFPFSAEEVDELVLETPRGVFHLVRSDEAQSGWRITSPVQAPADPHAVAALRLQVDMMRRLETLTDAEPASLGLEGPETLALTATAGDGRSVRVLVGREVPTRPAVYARTGDGPVFLADRSALSALDRSLATLRDLRLMPFQQGSLVEMRWQRPAPREPIAVRRESPAEAWRLVEPLEAPADEDLVGEIVARLAGLRALEVVAERERLEAEPDLLASFGLEEPRVRVRVEDNEGSGWRMGFGGLAPTEAPAEGEPPPYRVYARRPEGAVFVVDGELLKKVNAPLVTWRDRRAARVHRWNLQRVSLEGVGEGRSWTFERTAERTWTSPQAPGLELGWEDLDPLLDPLLEPRVLAYRSGSEIPDDAFDRPYLEVHFQEEGGAETGYLLGEVHEDNRALRWIRIEGGETGLVHYGPGVTALRAWDKLFAATTPLPDDEESKEPGRGVR